MTRFSRECDRAVLGLVILVLLLTPFAFGGVNQTKALLSKTFLSPVLFYSMYFARLGIALAVMLWLINMIVAREVRFAKTPLDIPIGLFLGYTFLWFIFSKSRFLTGGELANVLTYIALYYLVVNNVKTKFQMNFVVGALLFSGFVIATIGLVQCSGYFLPSSGLKYDYAVNLLRPRQYWGRVGGTFVCPNHFAGYLEMVIPFALAYVLFSKIPVGRKIFISFCGLVMVMGVLLSISRGGWGAFAVSAAFLFIMATREKKIPVAAWLIPLAVILFGVGAVLARSARVQKRFAMSFGKEDASYLKRAHVWLDTMALVRDHLLVGTGPGTFQLAYREYRRPSMLLAIKYTHNDYLHILSDYGAVGLAILLSGLLAFGRKMWRARRKLKRRNDKSLAYGVLGAVLALLVHSLVDFNMHIPSNAMTMAAIVGLGMALRQYRLSLYDEWEALSGRNPGLFPRSLQYGLVGVVVLATAGLLFVNFRSYASSVTLHRAAEKDPSREFPDQDPQEKDFEAAERLYRRAALHFPSNPEPWGRLGDMYLWRADEALRKAEKSKFYFLLLGWKEAMADYTRDYMKAAREIEKAKERNPLDSNYYLAHGKAYAGILYTGQEVKEGSPTQYPACLEKYAALFGVKGAAAAEAELRRYAGRAETEFQKALEMDPRNALYHEHLGFFYYRTGRYGQAEGEIQQALEILPDIPKYLKERKHLRQLLDKTQQHRQETEKVISAF